MGTRLPVVNIEHVKQRIKQELMNNGINLKGYEEEFEKKQLKYIDIPRISLPIRLKTNKSNVYSLNDFLNYHDEDFVINAYRGILKRNPDRQGLENYLLKLRKGEYTKVEIIGRLRCSKEAKKNKVTIKRLFMPFVMRIACKIPVIGYLLELFVAILKLPIILKNMREHQNFTSYRFGEQNKNLDSIFLKVEEELNQIVNVINNKIDYDMLNSLEEEISKRVSNEMITQIEERINTIRQEIQAIQKEVTNIESEVINVQEEVTSIESEVINVQEEVENISTDIKNNRLSIIEQQKKLSNVLNEKRTLSHNMNSISLPDSLLNSEEVVIDDALYVAFEDKFRGTREDIKNRLHVYLPYLERIKGDIGNGPILDVGCGRGEWLELIEENGYTAKGIDLNAAMVQQSRELGFDVVESDVIKYLKRQESNSIGAITGFHIIEHLPFNVLVSLFDESLRVLKPGGIIIFETPNPESMFVGSYSFYYDPSHLNPLVPDVMKFLAEQRGFSDVEILRLHKRKEPEYIGQEYIDEVIYKFNMEQDFSIIGKK